MKFNGKIATVILNCYMALSVIFFLIHLFAPLLGGKLLYSAVVKYGSWIGMAFTLKFISKKLLNRIRMKPVEWIFVSIYCSICMLLWFPYPINILFCFLVITGNIAGYKAQGNWQDGSSI